jgi:hypothetical protein
VNNNVDSGVLVDHDADVEQATALVRAYEHVQFIQQVHSDGIAVGVEYVVVANYVSAAESAISGSTT